MLRRGAGCTARSLAAAQGLPAMLHRQAGCTARLLQVCEPARARVALLPLLLLMRVALRSLLLHLRALQGLALLLLVRVALRCR